MTQFTITTIFSTSLMREAEAPGPGPARAIFAGRSPPARPIGQNPLRSRQTRANDRAMGTRVPLRGRVPWAATRRGTSARPGPSDCFRMAGLVLPVPPQGHHRTRFGNVLCDAKGFLRSVRHGDGSDPCRKPINSRDPVPVGSGGILAGHTISENSIHGHRLPDRQ